MIARLKMIAESLGMRPASSEGNVSDEMLECSIWQVGDGMGFTTIMNYSCGDTEDGASGKVCPA